jgi:uncharacterized protein YggT (Ycf19 family)
MPGSQLSAVGTREPVSMSIPTAKDTMDEYERRAEELEQSPLRVILKISRLLVWIIWAVVAVQAALLTVAFFLRLFGASTDAPFTQWVYRSAEHAMRPFRGIFPTREIGEASVLDTSLLFGALCYLVLALVIDGVHRWLGHKLAQQQLRAAAARANADAAVQQLAMQEYATQQTAAHDYAVAQAAAQQAITAQQRPTRQPPPRPT